MSKLYRQACPELVEGTPRTPRKTGKIKNKEAADERR
jgi:hypothetical protein